MLELEQREIRARLDPAGAQLSSDAMRRRIETTIRDFQGLLTGGTEQARRALSLVFGEDRLRARPHPEHGFAVEGVAQLFLDDAAPGHTMVIGRRFEVVAG